MRTLIILYKKELKHFFLTPFGWVVFAFVILLQGLSLSSVLEQYEKAPVQANILSSIFTTFIFWIYFLFLFPLITMKQLAEEEKSGTLENLLTAPVTTWQVVLSKYLSSYTFYLCLWIPVYLQLHIFEWVTGTAPPVTNGDIIGTFLILSLIGSFFTAVGILASALTSSQIIAAIITFGALAFHLFLGYIPMIAGDSFQGAVIFHYMAVQEHIAYFSRGLVDLRPVAYHLSMAVFTLILTHHIVDYRRWKH
ncbi:ABC-2 type transport system permease protein [Rubritalea squalenifaciens DSM 18772]|uniref:ABC-2 type transport system permease protein n=2 Tax=Rubritalea TaxID=361050 RepID=A0A1M6NCL9_9BACT|nr:ABC transporter permease [Rubritalea squalenifaciens]SHJ93441.1 ABC-2 type transport system permease protein [Rubritalea squalenifaciens DSM 18772]